MGWLKVAAAASPVTMFRWLLILVGVLVASFVGLVEMTAGAVWAMRFVLKPAAQPARSSAMNQVRDVALVQKLFIERFLMDAESGVARMVNPSAKQDGQSIRRTQ
jgi:hypothetical protein